MTASIKRKSLLNRKHNPSVTPLAAARKINMIKGTVGLPNLFHRITNKMGFGLTPELNAHIQSLSGADENSKILSYIDEQLDPNSIDDSVVDAQLTHGYQTLNKTRTQLYQDHQMRPDQSDIPWTTHVQPSRELFFASFLRATQSKKQLFELMVDFWHNHFNVYVYANTVPAMLVRYDRDVIRVNALGNFKQMLKKVTKSTCMGDYLGNAFNDKSAPNENYAREILELHTISAKNYLGHMSPNDVPLDNQGRKVGYVEADVLEMARILTGWSFNGADWDDYQNGAVSTGEFLFRSSWHDTDNKTIMGTTFSYDANNQKQDVNEVLNMLAEHPATAEFLATKLCKRFISDNPSQTIIDAVKDSLHQNWQAPDQIKLAMETLLKSNEFLTSWGEKVKRPYERVITAFRQLGFVYDFDPTKPLSIEMFWTNFSTGQNLFHWTTPNGFPDTKTAWLSASSLMATWKFMQWISRLRDDNDAIYNDILTQTISQFPNPNDRTANNLVDYWFERICGLPPDANTQDKLAQFMSYSDRDAADWAPSDRNTPIDITASDWPDYNEERLYAVITTIFLTAEFNYR